MLKPGPGIVLASLRLLIRISRHSRKAASQIVSCPGLMKSVLGHFLPPLIPNTYSTTSLYGAPVWLACKLCRTICCWDSDLAKTLTTVSSLSRSIRCYLTVDPADTALPSREMALLCIESYRTWCILLRHNLLTDVYTSLYPLFMKQLVYVVEKVEVVSAEPSGQFDLDVGSWMIKSLTAVLGASDGALAWNCVADLRAPLETCCKKWLVQLSRLEESWPHGSAFTIIATALNFMSLFYIKLKARPEFDPDAFRGCVTNDFKNIVSSFVTSSFFSRVGELMTAFSGYTSNTACAKRFLAGLPMCGAVLAGGAIHPVLEQASPVFFLSSFYRFVSVLNAFEIPPVPKDMAIKPLAAYFQRLKDRGSLNLAANWFSRFEARMLFWALSTQFKFTMSKDLHEVAVMVCSLLQRPDEILLRELFENAVFNPAVLDSERLLSSCMESLSVNSGLPLNNCSNLPVQSLNELLRSSLGNVCIIRQTYLNKLLSDRNCISSASFHNFKNDTAGSLVVGGETILSQDWQYFPLLQVYNWELAGKQVNRVNISDLRNCLAWLLITEDTTPRLSTSPGQQATAKFYRLATVFLAGNDLFLDPVVHNLLAALLRGLLASSGLPDLSLPVPGLTSGHEFYLQLLDQYQAVSYGDQLFSLFVVIPLAMSQPAAFRRSFWTDRPDLARTISLRSGHLGANLLQQFNQPLESDVNILCAYFRLLLDRSLMPNRNGLLYDITVSHLKAVVHSVPISPEIENFQKHVSSSLRDEQLKCDLGL